MVRVSMTYDFTLLVSADDKTPQQIVQAIQQLAENKPIKMLQRAKAGPIQLDVTHLGEPAFKDALIDLDDGEPELP